MGRLQDKDEKVKEASGWCPTCRGNNITPSVVTYTTEHKGACVIVIQNVPALECSQCGEIFYSSDVMEKLQKIVWGKLPPTKTIEVPAYDFTKIT
jgi:YgiT-type zinc finger domain-containing protein